MSPHNNQLLALRRLEPTRPQAAATGDLLASATTSPDAESVSTPMTELQPYSCLQCKHRKVRCDRIDPCINCRKTRIECVYRAPAPPKRKKRRYQDRPHHSDAANSTEEHGDLLMLQARGSPREQELLDKIRRYEHVLEDLGMLDRLLLNTDDIRDANPSPTDQPTSVRGRAARTAALDVSDKGRLIAKYGKSRYLENNLWTRVTDEFSDPKEILDESTEEETETHESTNTAAVAGAILPNLQITSRDPASLIFPMKGIDDVSNLKLLHPQPVQIFLLWQAYVENVNPLIKILHVPTTQKLILDATGNLEQVSLAVQALMFGIYVMAVSSMDKEQCQGMLHTSKADSLHKLRAGAQQALRSAGLLRTSDIMVLQAFVLFLLSAYMHYDTNSFWSLTGIAMRIGQRIGIHRDGESLKLPPFETEMRRRLWIAMMQLDSRIGELSGSGLSITTPLWDTKPPSSVNDCDLYPGMRELPAEQEAATEMMFLLLRARIGTFLTKEMPTNDTFDGAWSRLTSQTIKITEKDHAIDELEQILQERFIRHCDPHIPLHLITSICGRSALCILRLAAHLPRTKPDTPSESTLMAQGEEDLLLTNSIKILQYDTQLRTTKSLRSFLWHVDMHFQWHALIYLLTYLRNHPGHGSKNGLAWTTIDEVFANHPEITRRRQNRRRLCNAVCILTLKAWDAYEMQSQGSGGAGVLLEQPSCVAQLRDQNGGTITTGLSSMPETKLGPHIQQENSAAELQSYDLDHRNSNQSTASAVLCDIDGSSLPWLDANPVDWLQWDSMCRDFEVQDSWDDAINWTADHE